MKETFSTKLLKKSQRALFIVTGITAVVGIVSFSYSLFNFGDLKIPNVTAAFATLSLFSLFLAIGLNIFSYLDRYEEKLFQNIENSKRGIEGERLAKELISKTVGTSHGAFFNKDLPTGGDIDCLILGKKGLILIEIKNFSKQIRLPLFWTKGFDDPRNEAKRHATSLLEYFVENGYRKPLKIRKAVLYINKEVVYWGKQEVFNIRGLDRFAPYFFSLPLDSAITEQDIAEISSFIEKLK
ncbi:MAG: NERD domain-containing protein [Candidatus Moranbacteria bacterium]|nr:NERD domain-containing protein [Candidatus Moranbacteria bacterium]MBP6034226.1 NERD domain-containing protein [Candidatus Moranbacteria bacterium]